ncbi:MAG: hypothetical protein A2114_00880 [Candidatus Vogelbacteria bacterium GWA1_51_14]|uniref:Prepilin peptidase n=1 Tax=Candidatus Vogelbacteria bacterium GWA1_51_14 TaxID=1802435 RepID=A0A1G2QB35_9BACT|nr:MAG: hypothetical protein A2114_00880 [Candidatus Vogelbacteria bacterium GWA1_51_14]
MAITVIGYGLSALLGLVAGSFANVVILRYNTGMTLRGRSRCLSCSHQLTWPELIPVVSYFLQRGRCHNCQSQISPQYPLVEVITAAIFVLLFERFVMMPFSLLFYWVVATLLVIIAVYDWRHKIIPDGLVLGFIALGAIAPVITRLDDWQLSAVVVWWAHVILTALLFYFLFWALWRYSEGRWIGLGDAKLAAGLGLLLGFFQGVTALLVAFWAGALVGLALIALSKSNLPWRPRNLKLKFKSELPFAPFLIFGILLVLITNLNVVSF